MEGGHLPGPVVALLKSQESLCISPPINCVKIIINPEQLSDWNHKPLGKYKTMKYIEEPPLLETFL